MKTTYRYRGYTLLLALAVIIIVSSIAFLVISFFRMGDMLAATTRVQQDAAFYAHDGLAWVAGEDAVYSKYYTFHHSPYVISVNKERWGFYDCCSAFVLKGNDTVKSEIAFTGCGKNSTDSIVLYLGNTQKMLYVADSVQTEGSMYVPEAAIRAYGASSSLPSIHSTLFRTDVNPMPKPDITDAVEQLKLLPRSLENTHLANSIKSRSFKETVLVIQEDTAILDGPLAGKIAVCANVIIVNAGAAPDNVLLLAHNIFFRPGFHGRLQAFATDSIICENNCFFTYPSLLALLPDMSNKRPDSRQPLLTTGDSTIITGELLAISRNDLLNRRMFVSTGDANIITGSIYSSAFLRLRGTCYGSFFCEKLLENKNGAIQENMLYNVSLSNLKLPAFFTYSAVYPLKGDRKIIEKLH